MPSPLAYFICKNEIFLIKHKSYNIVVDVSVANYLIFQILRNWIYIYRPGQRNWEFDCGYSTVWKFSNFPVASLVLRETDFRRLKIAILTILEALNIDFWKNFTLENVKTFQKFKILNCSNGQDDSFWASKWSKLISRKIWMSEKSLNFHVFMFL